MMPVMRAMALCDIVRELSFRQPAGAVLVKAGEQFVSLALCSALSLDVALHFGLADDSVAIAVHRRKELLDGVSGGRSGWCRGIGSIARVRFTGGALLLQFYKHGQNPVAQL